MAKPPWTWLLAFWLIWPPRGHSCCTICCIGVWDRSDGDDTPGLAVNPSSAGQMHLQFVGDGGVWWDGGMDGGAAPLRLASGPGAGGVKLPSSASICATTQPGLRMDACSARGDGGVLRATRQQQQLPRLLPLPPRPSRSITGRIHGEIPQSQRAGWFRH